MPVSRSCSLIIRILSLRPNRTWRIIWPPILRSQEQAKALTENVEAAQKSLNLAVIQYREGITDFTTVLTAQVSRLSAEDNLANAIGNIASGLVGVYRALGGGWEIREGQNFVPAETTGKDGKSD